MHTTIRSSASGITEIPQVSKCPALFLNNSLKNQQILIIFHLQHLEETCHQKYIKMYPSLTTLEGQNAVFQQYLTVILIKQIIFQSLPQYWSLF